MKYSYLITLMLVLLVTQLTHAQSPDDKPITTEKPRPGVFLVAGRAMPDPRFQKTVILLLEHDEDGTLGLIVNRPTEIPLAEAIPDLSNADKHEHRLFIGGPVAMQSILFLVRDHPPNEQLKPIFADVYWSLDKNQLQKILNKDHGPLTVRVYLGHSGWAPEQLDAELEAGGWHLFEADSNRVFHQRPDTLWDWFMSTPQQILVLNE